MLWMKAPPLTPLRTPASSEAAEADQPVAALMTWLEMMKASGATPSKPRPSAPPAMIDAT